MNFIWAFLYNCKSSLFYWIFHRTFIIGGRRVLLKQTPQNMKVMNSSCFVTEQTWKETWAQWEIGFCTVGPFHNLPWLSQSLRVPLAHRGQFPAAPTTCWECTLCHLPSGRIDTAFENRRLEKRWWQNSLLPRFFTSRTTSCGVILAKCHLGCCYSSPGVQFPHWSSAESGLVCLGAAGWTPLCEAERRCHIVVHFALEMSSSVWGVNILGL